MIKSAIFLDRDGVINGMVYHPEFGLIDSPARPNEFRLLPGAAEGVRHVNELGFLAIVISNQPGIAKGRFTADLFEATQEKMRSELASHGAMIDGAYYCLHHPEAALVEYRQLCSCRKPKPGLLLQAADDWQIDLASSYFIGDGITDVMAGKNAGCKTILVNSRKCYICDELARQEIAPDFIAKNLADAVDAIARIEDGDPTAQELYRFGCQINCD